MKVERQLDQNASAAGLTAISAFALAHSPRLCGGGQVTALTNATQVPIGHRGLSATRRPRRPSISTLRAVSPKDTPTSDNVKTPEAQPSDDNSPKSLVTKYGSAFIISSLGMTAISLPAWYFLVRAGLDVQSLLAQLGDALEGTPVGRPAIIDSIPKEVGTFGLAYIAHKASSPIRFPFTLALTAWLAKKTGLGGKSSVEE